MKLRNKVLLSISFIWILFLGFTYAGSHYFLLRSFLELEQTRADRDIFRVDQSLEQIIYSLHTFTTDWAHWNDAYAFMQRKNPSFVKNNFVIPAFVNSNINLLMYWDIKNNLAAGIAVDTTLSKAVPFPLGLQNYLFPNSQLLTATDVNKDVHGILSLPSGIMLVAASAITNGNKTAPPLGTLIAGRYFSADLLQTMEKITSLRISLLTETQINQDVILKQIFQTISASPSGHLHKAKNQDTLLSYTLIRDINGKPIGMFQVATPRIVYLSGIHAINYYLASFIGLAILFSMLIIWLLRILIVDRLEHLDNDIKIMGEESLLSRRVKTDGTDEISSVAKKINSMMDTIEQSHTQLEQRVKERTHELRKTNLQLEQEIAERKTVEEELNIHKEHLVRLAHYDALTSLPNRLFFNEILNKAINHASRHGKYLAILFIDLDRFKNINDALGHPTGDLVLCEVAHRFATVLRSEDVLARLGGDEFIILLNDIDHPKFASPVAEKLLHECSKAIRIEGHEFFLTASIGVAIYPDNGTTLEDLQKNADMAMYKAKRSGGGVFHYFTQEMNLQAHKHIHLEAALRKAITNNEFVLYYQPKLNLSDGTLDSVEALIRWENPDLGLVNPSTFIPLAEETGLIMQIGEWALYEACRTNKSWQEQGYQPITVAVNISAKQFRHQDISQLISQVLTESGLEPQYLELEITETAVMDNVEQAVNKLTAISEMGVKITVDDFGTGYTSINYLKKFPVSFLKIDQIFIKGIPHNQNDTAITSAVIALAHSLGIKVVAEGVETAEQLQYLADQNCDIVQGYYLSRPLPEAKIILQFSRT